MKNNNNIQQSKFNPQQPLLDIKYISYANSCSTPIFIDSYLQGSFLENLNILNKKYEEFKNNNKENNIFIFKSFGNYIKHINNPNKNMYSIIKEIYEKFKDELKNLNVLDKKFVLSNENDNIIINKKEEEFNYKNLDKIEITYSIIIEISNILLKTLQIIFENSKNHKNLITNIINRKFSIIQTLLCFKTNDKKLELQIKYILSYIENLTSIKQITFDLGNISNELVEDAFFLLRILVFIIFYPFLFSEAFKIHFNLNIDSLNKIYNKEEEKNLLYLMDKDKIISIHSKYKNIFIANYLICLKIAESICERNQLIISIEQIDDYILEIDNLFRTECNLNKNTSPQDINMIFYNHFFKLANLWDFNLKINSLDNLLFKNYLFIFFLNFFNGKIVQRVEIDLFPQETINLNFRKILLNNLYYHSIKEEYYKKEYKENLFDWDYHKTFKWNNIMDNLLIKKKENISIGPIDEKFILEWLSDDFNENLLYLIIILEKNYQCTHINIKCNLPQFLLSKKSYIYSLSFFFYNLILLIYKKSHHIIMNYFKIESNVEFPQEILNYEKIPLILAKIQNFIVKIRNISKIINFDFLPFNDLILLNLSRMSNEDFKALRNSLILNKKIINKLRLLRLKYNYEIIIDLDGIFEFFKDCMIESVTNLKFDFKNSFIEDEYIKVICVIVNGLANSAETNKNLEVKSYLFNDDLKFNFDNTNKNIKSMFDYEKLNSNVIVSYQVFYYLKKYKDKKEELPTINVKLYKFKLEKKIEFLIKLIRQLDKNGVIKLEDSMKINTLILAMILTPHSYVNLEIFIRK